MMINDLAAATALDDLPLRTQVAAAYVDDDGTATVILFEHRDHDGQSQWWDITRGGAWWTAPDITRAFDDMVITAKPEPTSAPEPIALAEWTIDGIRDGILYAGRTTYHCVLCGCVMFGERFHDVHRAACPGRAPKLENRS